MKVVVVDCDDEGNVDVADLEAKGRAARANLACLMITYPSTHGVFEAGIRDICDVIHAHGGQVYMDGANMNAQVGLTSPGHHRRRRLPHEPAQDLLHPARRRRPGMGPIGLAAHLAPFMPGHLQPAAARIAGQGPVSAAPYGSASILPIAWMYIMMGGPGARHRDRHPQRQLHGQPPRPTTRCSTRARTAASRTSASSTSAQNQGDRHRASDIAKRLMDYGFHAPTMSFPVAGTIMIEPTESKARPNWTDSSTP